MISVGDTLIFNPTKKHIYDHVGIKSGEKVRVTKIGEPYTYYGMKPGEVCFPVDFVLISTGATYKEFSSQYFGQDDDDGFEL